MTSLRGSLFTGGKTENWERQEHDYYATPPEDTRKFLEVFDITKYNNILEPACGEGHMSQVIREYMNDNATLTSMDLIYRGYSEQIAKMDFLSKDINAYYNGKEKPDLTITNPPFKYALEFIKKGLELSDTVVILAKIQILEGISRSEKLKDLGLKEIYGNVQRCNCWLNGLEKNPKTGKSWSGAMFLAWYVFEKGYNGKPMYNWLF